MCALIDQDGNENRGKTMISQSCFMELEIGDRVQVGQQLFIGSVTSLWPHVRRFSYIAWYNCSSYWMFFFIFFDVWNSLIFCYIFWFSKIFSYKVWYLYCEQVYAVTGTGLSDTKSSHYTQFSGMYVREKERESQSESWVGRQIKKTTVNRSDETHFLVCIPYFVYWSINNLMMIK